MADDIKFFDYYKRPKDISLDTYLKVYDAFCQAYGIRIDDIDKESFSRDIKKKILDRYKPEGVDHRPVYGGNKQRARLMVMPYSGVVRFHAFSYDKEKDYVGKFITLAKKSLNIRESAGLESKL